MRGSFPFPFLCFRNFLSSYPVSKERGWEVPTGSVTGTEQLTHPSAAHSPLQEPSAESQPWCTLLQGVRRDTETTVFLKHLLVGEMDYNQGQQSTFKTLTISAKEKGWTERRIHEEGKRFGSGFPLLRKSDLGSREKFFPSWATSRGKIPGQVFERLGQSGAGVAEEDVVRRRGRCPGKGL